MDLARGMARWVVWILVSLVLTALALFPIRAVLDEGVVREVLEVLVFHAFLTIGGWWEWRRNRARAAE